MTDTMLFVYYEYGRVGEVHICNEDQDTLCGTGYAIDNGEFIYSFNEYDRGLAQQMGIDLSAVTCKRCLKKGNK